MSSHLNSWTSYLGPIFLPGSHYLWVKKGDRDGTFLMLKRFKDHSTPVLEKTCLNFRSVCLMPDNPMGSIVISHASHSIPMIYPKHVRFCSPILRHRHTHTQRYIYIYIHIYPWEYLVYLPAFTRCSTVSPAETIIVSLFFKSYRAKIRVALWTRCLKIRYLRSTPRWCRTSFKR